MTRPIHYKLDDLREEAGALFARISERLVLAADEDDDYRLTLGSTHAGLTDVHALLASGNAIGALEMVEEMMLTVSETLERHPRAHAASLPEMIAQPARLEIAA